MIEEDPRDLSGGWADTENEFPGPTPEAVAYEEFATAQGFSKPFKRRSKLETEPHAGKVATPSYTPDSAAKPVTGMADERKTVQRWADSAMFTAAPIDAAAGPRVYLLSMTPDPLGAIAAACMGYEGRNVHSLAEVTDDDRAKYFEQVQKTHLKAPFEFVQFHFLIEGVTRGFTHQMVRQRTATFVQESTRFAVKEDMPVGLPPSLAGTTHEAAREYDRSRLSKAEQMRAVWEDAKDGIAEAYDYLVDKGMPAEDARGLLPTNLLTRIQYRTDLRSLIEHGGNRLCTQAQFEWRVVFSKIVEAIRNFKPQAALLDSFHPDYEIEKRFLRQYDAAEEWQFQKIADVFRPICYLTGKCEFRASFDRACSIRNRVDANAAINRPSSEWDTEKVLMGHVGDHGEYLETGRIDPISPAEWLEDPGAAR